MEHPSGLFGRANHHRRQLRVHVAGRHAAECDCVRLGTSFRARYDPRWMVAELDCGRGDCADLESVGGVVSVVRAW